MKLFFDVFRQKVVAITADTRNVKFIEIGTINDIHPNKLILMDLLAVIIARFYL